MNQIIFAASLDDALAALPPAKLTLADIVKAAAGRLPGVDVEIDRSMGTVCISAQGEEDIFMQGDEADEFIAEVDKLWNDAQHVTEDEAALCAASPYVECIWN